MAIMMYVTEREREENEKEDADESEEVVEAEEVVEVTAEEEVGGSKSRKAKKRKRKEPGSEIEIQAKVSSYHVYHKPTMMYVHLAVLFLIGLKLIRSYRPLHYTLQLSPFWRKVPLLWNKQLFTDFV